MTLREKQSLFAALLGAFIFRAGTRGWAVTLGEGYVASTRAYRDAAGSVVVGAEDAVHMRGSLHHQRLACDLNLFVDGEYVADGSLPGLGRDGRVVGGAERALPVGRPVRSSRRQPPEPRARGPRVSNLRLIERPAERKVAMFKLPQPFEGLYTWCIGVPKDDGSVDTHMFDSGWAALEALGPILDGTIEQFIAAQQAVFAMPAGAAS